MAELIHSETLMPMNIYPLNSRAMIWNLNSHNSKKMWNRLLIWSTVTVRTENKILLPALIQTIQSPVVALRIWYEPLVKFCQQKMCSDILCVRLGYIAIGDYVPYAAHILNLSSDLTPAFWECYWYYNQKKNSCTCYLNDHCSIWKEMAAGISISCHFLPQFFEWILWVRKVSLKLKSIYIWWQFHAQVSSHITRVLLMGYYSEEQKKGKHEERVGFPAWKTILFPSIIGSLQCFSMCNVKLKRRSRKIYLSCRFLSSLLLNSRKMNIVLGS